MSKFRFQKLIAVIFIIVAFAPIRLLAESTTSVTEISQVMSGGVLILTSDSTVTFPSKILSSVSQSASGSVNISISDTRGTGVGWSVTMSQTHLTTTQIIADSANLGTMVVTENSFSRFDGSMLYEEGKAHCTYIISAREDSQFDVALQGEDNCTDTSFASVTTDSAMGKAVGATGIFVDVSGTAKTGDIWYLKTDTLAYTDTQIICQNPVVVSGSADRVSSGTCGSLSGSSTSSDASLVLATEPAYGMGQFSQEIQFFLTIHGNALSGTYRGTLLFTII